MYFWALYSDPLIHLSHYASVTLPWFLHLYDSIQDPAHHTLLALHGDTVDDNHFVCSLIFLMCETVVLLLSNGDGHVDYLWWHLAQCHTQDVFSKCFSSLLIVYLHCISGVTGKSVEKQQDEIFFLLKYS